MSNTNLLGAYGGLGNSGLQFRNRIINGDMRIDQRYAGSEITVTTGGYIVDRWQVTTAQSSKLKIGQNAGAVTPPSGFTNYLGVTSLSSYSLVGNDSFSLQHIIEGFNISDFGWGTADAKPATLSFWVRSSLTGTFGGSIATTGSGVWVLPFSFTISSANTWTYITVNIPAGTSALTNNDNSSGIFVRFGLGSAGTTIGGTAGTWTNADNYIQPTGTVSLVGTDGATFYLTGVQLEAGPVATPFEHRPYGLELSLCQRYYYRTGNWQHTASATSPSGAYGAHVYNCAHPVTMRNVTSASVTLLEVSNGGSGTNYTVADAQSKVSFAYSSNTHVYMQVGVNALNGTVTQYLLVKFKVESEL